MVPFWIFIRISRNFFDKNERTALGITQDYQQPYSFKADKTL
jgi:hypothetical protein